MAISAGMFRDAVSALTREADQFIREYGFVQETILGVNPTADVNPIRVHVAAADPQVGMKTPPGVTVIPPPLQNHEATLRAMFQQEGVQAAIWRGEAWMFPDDDPEAGVRFMSGDGPSPSQHPRRVEVVMISGFWPLQGLALFEGLRIVRAPSGAYTRTWKTSNESSIHPNGFSMLTSWLEHALPQPDSR